jgi:hypothetical protein
MQPLSGRKRGGRHDHGEPERTKPGAASQRSRATQTRFILVCSRPTASASSARPTVTFVLGDSGLPSLGLANVGAMGGHRAPRSPRIPVTTSRARLPSTSISRRSGWRNGYHHLNHGGPPSLPPDSIESTFSGNVDAGLFLWHSPTRALLRRARRPPLAWRLVPTHL